jgi:hypothetical protein
MTPERKLGAVRALLDAGVFIAAARGDRNVASLMKSRPRAAFLASLRTPSPNSIGAELCIGGLNYR